MSSSILRTVKQCLPTPVRRVLFDLKLRIRSLLGRKEAPFKAYQIEREVFGETLQIHIGNAEGRLWYEGSVLGEKLSEELRFLRETMLVEGDIVFDCGAHHGVMTTLLARWVGASGRVIAFDPVPQNVEFSHENLRINSINNAEVIHAAVGAKHGEITFSDGSNASVGFGGGKNTARLVRLDDFAALKPTFLKIDVEGFETEVLKGAPLILATRPKIMMELHGNLLDMFGTSVEEVMAFFDPTIYRLWIQRGEWEAPVRLEPGTKIARERVHIFALPRAI